MSKILQRLGLENRHHQVCILTIIEEWHSSASTILYLEDQIQKTDLSQEDFSLARDYMKTIKSLWINIKESFEKEFNWDNPKDAPWINFNDPYLKRVKEANESHRPLILLLANNNNKDVAENYFLE